MPSFSQRLSQLKSAAQRLRSASGLSRLAAGTRRAVTSAGKIGRSQLQKAAQSKVGRKLLSAILKSPGKKTGEAGKERELEALADFLRGAGYDIISPQERANKRPVSFDTGDWGEGAGQSFPQRGELPEPTEFKRPRQATEFESSVGDAPDELRMVRVNSSNVHSIGFVGASPKSDTGTLFIRFLGQEGKRRAGPGALYEYHDVPRRLWIAFNLASSKGKFVWDNIRVRGTVSGHRYSYEFIGTGPRGYIPRRATLMRGKPGEFYLRRTFKGRQSPLANQKVRQSGPNPGRGPGAKHLILKKGRK